MSEQPSEEDIIKAQQLRKMHMAYMSEKIDKGYIEELLDEGLKLGLFPLNAPTHYYQYVYRGCVYTISREPEWYYRQRALQQQHGGGV